MDKRILICLLVIVIIVGVVLLLTNSKEPEKHVHFEEPSLEPLPSISPMELELAQESTTEPSETKPEASTAKEATDRTDTTKAREATKTAETTETFQMPHFNVCGGTISRSKNEQEIAKMQPRFQSFGVSRGMVVGESELEAVSFDDNQRGAFRRLGSSGPERIQPRINLATKMQGKDAIEAMLSVSNPESTTASTSVLNKIDDAKESMKPKKRSKAK